MRVIKIFWLGFLVLWGVCVGAQDKTEFEQLVAARGFKVGVTDYSSVGKIEMEEPRLAFVNLTGFANMPTAKNAEKRGWMEVYDGAGRYFKVPVTLRGQGGYSLKYPKRNFVCHFCDSLWNEENGLEMRIGEWVTQSSFHFKAFYTDFLRGIGEVGYKLYEQMVSDRLPFWERVGQTDSNLPAGGFGNTVPSRARCFPDAFPCVVYLNGEFYGVFAWQLKKSRKNMNMKKEVAEHIHLDGNLNNDNLFLGNIKWSQFEVRNPQNLYDKEGELYNGNKPKELIDNLCEAYQLPDDMPEVKEAKQRTARVKQYIKQLSRYKKELDALVKENVDTAVLKQEIERRYEIQSLIDYYVLFYLQVNCDGTLKNWQWFTYDGQHWSVAPYDLDQTFGINLYGVVRPAAHDIEPLISGPFYWVHRYYQKEIRQRYHELRKREVIDAANINQLADDWYNRVGSEFYAKERQRWNTSPCYCTTICNTGWEVCEDWELYGDVEPYYASYYYHAGDVCRLEGRLWRATIDRTSVKPYIRNANIDTIGRLHAWVKDRIEYLDGYFSYTPTPNGVGGASAAKTPRSLEGVFTLSGMKVDAPLPRGIYIFKYSDGTSEKKLISQ